MWGFVCQQLTDASTDRERGRDGEREVGTERETEIGRERKRERAKKARIESACAATAALGVAKVHVTSERFVRVYTSVWPTTEKQ